MALAWTAEVIVSDESTAATNLIAGVLTRYLVLALNIGAGVVLMPFTVRHLGRAEYGLWMLVASFTAYLQLLDLGYGNGIVRHLVEADRRGDTEGVNEVVSTFVCVYAAIAAVACAAIAVIDAVAVPRFPHLSASQVRTAQVVMAILGARVAAGFPLTVFGAVTNARQGFARNNVVASVIVVMNAIATYVVLRSGGSLVELVITTTMITFAGYGGYAWTAHHIMPDLRIRLRYFSAARWRQVTHFSLYLFVIQIATQLSFNIDTLVVGASLGPALVAVYAVALRLAEYQRRLCDQFSNLLFPVTVAFGTDGNRAALQQTLIEGNRIGATLVGCATVCLVGQSDVLIRRWMGAGFEGSVTPFVVLAIAGVIVVSQAASSNVLIGIGNHRLVAWIWIGEAVANVVSSIVLVRLIGLSGVAIGTLVPLIVGHLGVMLPAACRRVGLSVTHCLRVTMRPAAVAAAIASCACIAIRHAHPPASGSAAIAEALCVGVIYVGSLAFVGFDRATRGRYASQLLAFAGMVTLARARRPATIAATTHEAARALLIDEM